MKCTKMYNINTIELAEVSKGCAGLVKPAGCKEAGKTTVCYCHDDFCNSAGSFQIYPVLIVSLILASLLT